jgi:hypothetical protein
VYAALLEDDERRVEAMRAVLAAHWPDLRLIVFDDAPAMISWMASGLAETRVILLDHDLGPSRPSGRGERFDPGDGRDVTRALACHAPQCPVLIHSTNSTAVPQMRTHLEDAGWLVRRVVPFSDLEWVEASWLPELAAVLEPGQDA